MKQPVFFVHVLFCGKMIFCFFFFCLLSYFSAANVKDEPPDTWDEEEQQREESEKDDKEKLRIRDKDLEFLYQEVVRDNSMDEWLKRDLQSKKSDRKYKEMLVRKMFLKTYITLVESAIYFSPHFSKIELNCTA